MPPKRILRLHEAKPEDMRTLEELKNFCEKNKIRYFVHAASNELSHFGEAKDKKGAMISVAKKTLRGVDYQPIFQYSDLLQKYNEKMRFVDFFVWREDSGLFEANKKQF